MRNKKVFRTNLLISVILIVGFALTAVFSYRANYQTSLSNIEQVSDLTAEGIYYQLTAMLTRPLNVSLTMARDSLLVEHLNQEAAEAGEEEYIQKTKRYLNTYKEKYGFDSVFLVSADTSRYYNFGGVDRVLERDDAENQWYYQLLESGKDYDLNVDNDEVEGANNEITVFVNCKVKDYDGKVLGIVGVGVRIDYLKELLESYESSYDLKISLIDQQGAIEVSTSYNGYEKKDWFRINDKEEMRSKVLDHMDNDSNLELWSHPAKGSSESYYVVTRCISELSWHLVVEQNTGKLVADMRRQITQSGIILFIVIAAVLITITRVIRKFNVEITDLQEEKQAIFQKATEQLYDNIYELNITKNCYVGNHTEQYFNSLGAKGLPYDQGLRVIAEKQIKEEFREGYVDTFSPENVLREFVQGNDHLRYDFMMTENGKDYFWMRIDAFIFYYKEDDSVHMFTYRKNINAEKKRERRAAMDGMTGFYVKSTFEHLIEESLKVREEEKYAFYIFDIDNFKRVNDRFGHAFGDACIKEFTQMIRNHFRDNDILGRIGGDEFGAFIPIPDAEYAKEKAEEVSKALNMVCTEGHTSWKLSASIGVAVAPEHGTDFTDLYKNADTALYQTKQNGKNGYTIYHIQ